MLADRLQRLGLNPREQRIATVAIVVLAAFVVLLVPVGLGALVRSRAAEVDELRSALEAVQGARAQVKERKAKKEGIAQRYAQKAPPLAGFLAQLAKAQKVEVTDSQDRQMVPIGKRYEERATTLHLKKSGLAPISTFLEAVAKSGNPVAVTRLNVRRRSGEPDSYDVEVGVSAYDRKDAPPAPAPAPAGGDGDDGKGKK